MSYSARHQSWPGLRSIPDACPGGLATKTGSLEGVTLHSGARFNTKGKRAAYASYLLRLWREGEAAEGWRASLHDPHTGERLGFAGLDELFGFLQEQAGVRADASETRCRPDPAERDPTIEQPN